jgi:hypothetical protein
MQDDTVGGRIYKRADYYKPVGAVEADGDLLRECATQLNHPRIIVVAHYRCFVVANVDREHYVCSFSVIQAINKMHVA